MLSEMGIRGISAHPSGTPQTFLIKRKVDSSLWSVFISHGKVIQSFSALSIFIPESGSRTLSALFRSPFIQTFITFSRFLLCKVTFLEYFLDLIILLPQSLESRPPASQVKVK